MENASQENQSLFLKSEHCLPEDLRESDEERENGGKNNGNQIEVGGAGSL
jgi:hypothetical protein